MRARAWWGGHGVAVAVRVLSLGDAVSPAWEIKERRFPPPFSLVGG
jgi:hypothetical protein